jgi:nucleotide-binding universal stress UspA family protein
MPGSEVRVVVAQDLMKAFPASLLDVPAEESAEGMCWAGKAQAEQFAAMALEELRADLGDNGVTVSSVIDDGPPKQVLVRHVEEFGADCIFTGATGYSSRVERFLLGSVSAAVAARAHCSVEVVRS